MFYISQIISKEVISIYESQSIGTIKNVVFNDNLTKVKKFVFFNDDTDTESCVKFENVYCFSNNGIMIKNMSRVDFFLDKENNPINKKIYSLNAGDFGKICDVCVDEKGFVCSIKTSSGKELNPLNIVSIKNLCLVNDNDNSVKISSFRPKNHAIKKSEILDTIQVKIIQMNEEKEQKTSIQLPTKITTNTNALIGKKALKTIIGKNNEVIIKQNNIISKHTLNLAKIHNKTNDLVFNSI